MTTEPKQDDVVTDELVAMDASVAMEASERGQLDVQIATAKQYPRSIDKARKDALALATGDEFVARSCLYALPRGGKVIEGPSVRLAEIIAHTWGNIRVQGEVVSIDDKAATLQATCLDLEKNVGFRVTVRRRITGKHGRYNEDMINMTCNAGISVALRNAIFKVVPKALWNSIYLRCRKTAAGDEATFKDRKKELLKWYKEKGATPAQVCEFISVRGTDDIGGDEYITLLGIQTSIETGETNIERLLSKGTEQSDKTQDMNREIAGNDNKDTK